MLRTVASTLALVLAFVLPAALACIEYKITVVQDRPCAYNNPIFIQEFSLELVERERRCVAVVKESFAILQDVQEMKTRYTVSNGVVKFEGDIDGCKEMDSMHGEADILYGLLGMPKECPIKAGEWIFMDGREVDVTKVATYLSKNTGSLKIKIDVDHGNGVRSCISFSLNIVKLRT